MNFQAKVTQDRVAEREANKKLWPGLQEGIERRLKAREPENDLRQRRKGATEGMHKKRRNIYSAGEQFDSDRHQSIDGEPVTNKDGSFRLKPGHKKIVPPTISA